MSENSNHTQRLHEKTYLDIPYQQKDEAKKQVGKLKDGSPGLAWDRDKKSWYAKPGVLKATISPWLPSLQQTTLQTPVDEFNRALINLGAIVLSGHPIMDGKPHRIPAEGDKNGQKAIFYVGHYGVPAGYIKNNRSGEELKWRSHITGLTDNQKAELSNASINKKKQREEEITKKQLAVALKLSQTVADLNPVTAPTAYITSKGIQVHKGIYHSKYEQDTLCIPATDINGKIWSMQYVLADGSKRFAKDAKKEGCFHAIGGVNNLAIAPVIVIAEGYATAASIKEACSLPVVVSAFDAGNLKPVAESIREKYPNKPILIAGDDDKHLEVTQGINPGKEKAEAAAKAVNGHFILPVFGPNEQANNPRQFSDFNDLANNSELASGSLNRQIGFKINNIIQISKHTRSQLRILRNR